MGLEDIIEAAERVGDEDEARRAAFQEEFARYEDGDLGTFSRTRAAIESEREALERLREGLDEEVESTEELAEYADFLTVDQAVEHRDEALEKLERHNEELLTFHGEMSAALDAVESNLDALETGGLEAVEADPEPHFERAREALERHNEAVEGLGKNMTILNAYLV